MQLASTRYDLRVESLRTDDSFIDAKGLALSLEGGWPFILNDGDGRSIEDGRWRLEPQGGSSGNASTWTTSTTASHKCASPTAIRWSHASARVSTAMASARTIAANFEPATRLRANIWREFRGEPRADFATNSGYVPFAVDLGGSWAEVGIGGAWQVSQTGYLFADIDYSWGFDGDETAWNGKLGMRWNW